MSPPGGPAPGGADEPVFDPGALPLDAVDDPVAVQARCDAKVLQREGVPMVLALEDVTSPPSDHPGPAGPAEATLALGERLADRVEAYRAVLRPQAADDDYWAVHDVLVVVSDAHGPTAGGQA